MPYSLREISDRLEITDLYARYVHAVDEHDHATMDAHIFLPATTFDWSGANPDLDPTSAAAGSGPVSTWSEMLTSGFPMERDFPYTFHVCTNVRIDFATPHGSSSEAGAGGPDAATVKSKTVHPVGLDDARGGRKYFQVHGAYVDRLVRTDRGWRIAGRKWEDGWVVGPFERVEGMAGMLRIAGRS